MKFRKAIIYLLAAVCVISRLPAAVSAAGEGMSVRLSGVSSARVGERIVVRVTVTASEILAGTEFELHYDPAHAKPVMTDNTENAMDAFIVSAPAGWEQMCSHDAVGALYKLRFVCDEAEKNLLQKGKTLVAEVPFDVVSAGNMSFSVPESGAIAVGADKNTTLYGGSGDRLDIIAAGNSEKLSAALSGAETVSEDSVFGVSATVTNIGDDSGVIGFQFELAYDKTAVAPVVTDNSSSQMDSFIVSAPGNGWEQMCTHDAAGGRYILRFAAKNAGTKSEELLKRGGTMTVSVPFKVIGTSGKTVEFSVSGGSVLGTSLGSVTVSGVGSDYRTEITAPSSDPIPSGEYEIIDGIVTDVREKTSVADFLKKSAGEKVFGTNGKELTKGYVGTGCTVKYTNGDVCTVLVNGDVNGSGTADATDYLMAKRCYLGTYTLRGVYLCAACITGKQSISPTDLLLLKRHVLGTADIYTVAK